MLSAAPNPECSIPMPRSTPGPMSEGGDAFLALKIPALSAVGLFAMAQIPYFRGHEHLYPVMLAAAAFLVVWGAVVAWTARAGGRRLVMERVVRRPHWVQACAQTALFLYWGWHARTVYAVFPLIVAQIVFAYGVDALVAWSRRDTHRLGFGPLPIILSINLFLLFRPESFHWQFVMIVVGYLAKDAIRWQRDGRSAHIFNPSSFPLALTSLALIVFGATDLTLGSYIAQSQSSSPGMYLAIFVVSIAGQLLFGVATMTLSAVLSMVAISAVYFAATGTYMFPDAFITVPVFLGMHLLITDPSTSPRTEAGQWLWGVIYALGVTALYFILEGAGLPTFYEKLLPVPLMNLAVRRIDGWARSGWLHRLDPARIGASLTPGRRNVAYTSAWVGVFALFSAGTILGDDHPGQYYPFWRDACAVGNERACEIRAFMAYNYCNRGSGWACNEYGAYLAERNFDADARRSFRRACDQGFEPGCENAMGFGSRKGSWVHAVPRMEDLPIVLRGSKGPVRERDPTTLLAMACEQGWPLCDDARE